MAAVFDAALFDIEQHKADGYTDWNYDITSRRVPHASDRDTHRNRPVRKSDVHELYNSG